MVFVNGHFAWNKGLHRRLNTGKTLFKKGQTGYWKGKTFPESTIEKMRTAKLGKKQSEEIKIKRGMYNRGEKHWNWKGNNCKKREIRNDPAYQNWRYKIYRRDSYKCKINNKDCNGRLEAHHILSWKDYPELRYDVNNGITLCKFHHPRKKIEVLKLVQTFQGLVLQINERNY